MGGVLNRVRLKRGALGFLRSPSLLWLSALAALVFWLAESMLHAVYDRPPRSLAETLIPRDLNEFWMRLLIVALIMAIGYYARRSVNDKDWSSMQKIAGILEGSSDAYLAVDAGWRLNYMNKRAEALFRIDRAAVLGQPFWDAFPEAASSFYKPFLQSFNEGRPLRIDGFYAPGGLHLEVHTFPGESGMSICLRDITLQREREKALSENYKRLQTILDNASDGIVTISGNGLVETFNKAAERIFGYSAREVVGKNVALLMPEREAEHHDASINNFLRSRVSKIIDVGPREVDGRHKDGHLLPLELAVGEMRFEEDTYFIGILRDITERRRAREVLEFMSNFDPLTGLPNRSLLRDRLDHAIRQAHREEHLLAVMFLDLDRFKNINDTLGHAKGDRLLQSVADRLEGCVREGDTVARLSGDEFVIVLEGIRHVDNAASVAEKVLAALSAPVDLGGHEVIVSASIGITIYPFDDDNIDDLLKDADTAMYRAKEQGRNHYQYFTADMTQKALEHLSLEQDLRRALERGELHLHYQPQVELESGKVIGVETLLRWQHPKRGMVPPSEFIPLLEDTGLILSVGEWTMRTACNQARQWQREGLPPLRISVNLSARQFQQKDLARRIGQVLAQTGLNPTFLELEITEGLLVENVPTTTATLEALHRMGLRLSVDDFGTGYSSLSYLKRFPLHALKVDQSFIRDVTKDADSAAIVGAIVALARSLRLELIAEGVESAAQLTVLRGLGCEKAQGYFFCAPADAETIGVWLKTAGGRQPQVRA